jgi:hypothetical protein
VSKSPRRPSRAIGGSSSTVATTAGAGTRTGSGRIGPRETTTTRHGRRDRPRYGSAERSFFERHRGTLLTVAAGAVAVLIVGWVFLGATARGYSCGSIWEPDPTPSPSAGEPARLGYLQRNMGRSHEVNRPQRYALCPPASGNHYNISGVGPIQARLYGPDDKIEPMSWVHNLEHGALVVLYKCVGDACEDAGQDRMREFYSTFPNSPICNFPRGDVGPVIARFDDMAWPYAAIVWGRVLPLQTFDAQQILEFFNTEAERTNPELIGCVRPSPSASPGASGSASPSTGSSASPSSSSPAASSPASSASASPR